MLAAVVMLAGCGPNGRPSGVVASASERPEVAGAEVTTPTFSDEVAAESADVDGIDARDEPADEVETLVEPVVPRPYNVAVVGDSLTLSAEDEILAALTAEGLEVLTIDGIESRRMTHGDRNLPPGTEAIENIQRLVRPGLWVIALGTNDVASVESLEGFRTQMREVLDLIPPDDPVIWVDLWIRGREEPISRANEMIRAELRRRQGGAAVVDWYSHGTDDGIITGDGVHLTDAGQRLFAASIAAAVDDLFDG